MRKTLLLTAALLPAPAFAAGSGISLANTDFVVFLAFLLFIGILFYFKVPGMITGMLDKRADAIRSDLDEAKALREDAQTILASYERKQKEVAEQADRIVEAARRDAEDAATQAKEDLKTSIARRLQAAEEQIASAQASAVQDVRDKAISAAISAAASVVASKTTKTDQNKLIDEAISTVQAKLH